MKKRFILFAALILSAAIRPVSAQSLRFGVEAGTTFSWAEWGLSKIYDKESLMGGTVGFTAEYGINDNIWLQSALQLSSKGAKASGNSSGSSTGKLNTKTFRPVYLEIPVTVAYKFRISDKLRIFGAAGGFIAEGLFGQYKNETLYYIGNKSSKTENIFSDEGGFKRFDAGITAGVGAEFGRFVLRANCNWGMLSAANNSTVVGSSNFKNRTVSVVAGYKFR